MSIYADLYRYRELFGNLWRRDLQTRYKGSALGVLWSLINPLILMGIYVLVFSLLWKVAQVPHYALYLLVGLTVWLFFSSSLTTASRSLLDSAALIRKVRFPRETIPASVVTVQLVTFTVVFALVAIVTVAVVGTFGPELLLVIPLMVCLFAFVLGLSLLVSVLHAYFRDVAPILSAALLPWFFLSPIFFEVTDITKLASHEWARILLTWINPIAPFITALRSVVYDGAVPDGGVLLYTLAAAVIGIAAGTVLFRRLQAELAVVV